MYVILRWVFKSYGILPTTSMSTMLTAIIYMEARLLEDNIKIEKSACRALMCNEHFIPLSIRPENTYIIFRMIIKDGKSPGN